MVVIEKSRFRMDCFYAEDARFTNICVLLATIWHRFAIGRNAELVLANAAMRKQVL
jgi:hypothetical protein